MQPHSEMGGDGRKRHV